MASTHFVHFSQLTLARKVLFTGALCVLGIGYLAAMVYIYMSHFGRDGKETLSVQDIIIAYAGSKSSTRLESALMGPMSKMLQPDENLQIIDWVRKGADKSVYESKIAALMEKRCVVCHNDRNPHLPSLESYEGVMKVAEKDTGFNIPTLVRVSHIHLFGLTFIFVIAGFVFTHAQFRRQWLQALIVLTPFLCIVADIGSWYLTKLNEGFAWMVIASGAAMGTCFGIMFVISMWQMWISRAPKPYLGVEAERAQAPA